MTILYYGVLMVVINEALENMPKTGKKSIISLLAGSLLFLYFYCFTLLYRVEVPRDMYQCSYELPLTCGTWFLCKWYLGLAVVIITPFGPKWLSVPSRLVHAASIRLTGLRFGFSSWNPDTSGWFMKLKSSLLIKALG